MIHNHEVAGSIPAPATSAEAAREAVTDFFRRLPFFCSCGVVAGVLWSGCRCSAEWVPSFCGVGADILRNGVSAFVFPVAKNLYKCSRENRKFASNCSFARKNAKMKGVLYFFDVQRVMRFRPFCPALFFLKDGIFRVERCRFSPRKVPSFDVFAGTKMAGISRFVGRHVGYCVLKYGLRRTFSSDFVRKTLPDDAGRGRSEVLKSGHFS